MFVFFFSRKLNLSSFDMPYLIENDKKPYFFSTKLNRNAVINFDCFRTPHTKSYSKGLYIYLKISYYIPLKKEFNEQEVDSIFKVCLYAFSLKYSGLKFKK